MKSKNDLKGKRFGRLTVIEASSKRSKSRNMYWVCQCDCGNVKDIASQSLVRGLTVSCGCYNKEVNLQKNTKHGFRNTPTYKSWDKMIHRCTNPNDPEFDSYGGRGIKVCKEWKDFSNFIADMGERPPKTSIDRIDVNKGYFKDNCRWSDQVTQANNTRRNVYVEYKGERKTIAELAKQYNIQYDTLYCRLRKYGWSIEDAINKPSK